MIALKTQTDFCPKCCLQALAENTAHKSPDFKSQFPPSAQTLGALSSAECCNSQSVLTPFHTEEMQLSGRSSPGAPVPGSHWKCGNGSEPLIHNKESRNLNAPNNNNNLYHRQQFPAGISSLLENTTGNLSNDFEVRESAPFAGKKEK